MNTWYVKDMSKLTGVSVQTLHHYDHIGLLKPSARSTSGYRLYAQADLFRLQQIIALKCFGFGLAQIQNLLAHEPNVHEHLLSQVTFLEKKAQSLLATSEQIKAVLKDVKQHKSMPWETIITLMEVYRMTEQLEDTWVKDIFSADELKEYSALKADLKSQDKAAFEASWQTILGAIRDHLDHDPTSPAGIAVGEQCMTWVNQIYGKKHAHLRTKKFEQGFGEGLGLEEVGLTPPMVQWMGQAMDAYWRQRILHLLSQVGQTPETRLKAQWQDLLEDMYGYDTERQDALYDTALKDAEISEEAKTWLRSIR